MTGKPYLISIEPNSIDPGDTFTVTVDWSGLPEGTESIEVTIDYKDDDQVQDITFILFKPIYPELTMQVESEILTAPATAVAMTVTESTETSEPLEVTIGD